MSGLLITGTDTDAGKTLVTLALMHHLQQQGFSVLGFKPVASGCPDWRGADALALQAQGSTRQPYELINPWAFVPPIAPHLAAALAGVYIELAPIVQAYQRLHEQADWVLVEGVGGWRVPLAANLEVSDLAKHLQLPVVLVVGGRLGCLNHAQLTVESILAQGSPLIGWIGTQCDPAMHYWAENIATLYELLPVPCLGVIPWLNQPTPEQASQALDAAALKRMIEKTT